MASLIRIKRSEVSGNPAVLGAGELAYSALPDDGSNGGDRLYIGSGPEIAGNAANHLVIGGTRYTGAIDSATHQNLADRLVKRDSLGNFKANSITASLQGNASSANIWSTARTITYSGDVLGEVEIDGSANVTSEVTLKSINADVGSFGSETAIPVVTVNDKGLVTSVSTTTVFIPEDARLSIIGDTGADSIHLSTEDLTFVGGTGVTTSASAGKLTIGIGQDVSPTSTVTFASINVADELRSNNITADEVTIDGDAVISGNLTVLGTTTTINASELAVSDINITIAKDATSAEHANGAGLTVAGPTVPATLLYMSSNDRWALNKNLSVETVYGNLVGGVTGDVAGNASSASTAAKLTAGRTISTVGDVLYTSASFDGTTNVSGTATLATVNSNVGSFGTSTTVPTFTVNAKGLITAASNNTIPTATTSISGLAKFNSQNFTVSSGMVSISAVDGGTY